MNYGGQSVADLQHQIDAGREGAVLLLGRVQLVLVSVRLARPRLVLVRLRMEQWLRLGRPLWLERLVRRSGSPLRASPVALAP